MIKEIEIESLKCVCVGTHNETNRILYMIYPAIVPFKHEWLAEMAIKFNVPIVVIYIPADGWNNMLTPWPAPGETSQAEPFGGDATATLKIIREKVISQTDEVLGIVNSDSSEKKIERDLIGVSLSGLFTFWQWMLCDTFTSIASLSGSFWYPKFMDWFKNHPVPHKNGKAFFLLGDKEPKAWIKEFRTVGVNTESIVARLKESGINVTFEWVPGDHFADPTGRAIKAMTALTNISNSF